MQGLVVDDNQGVVSGVLTDKSEDGSDKIARQNTDNKGDQLDHIFAVSGAEHGHRQGHETADQSHIHRAAFYVASHQVADGIAGKAQTDDCNRGSDDDGGHQFVDPLDTAELDNHGNDHIHETGDQSTDNQSCVADGDGCSPAEGGEHGTDECEGRTEKHRTGALGEEQINNGADTGAEEGRRGTHAISDNCRNCDCRRHNGQQLLQGEEDNLAEFRLVLDSIDKIHTVFSFSFCLLSTIYRKRGFPFTTTVLFRSIRLPDSAFLYFLAILSSDPSGTRPSLHRIPEVGLPPVRNGRSEDFSLHSPRGSEVPCVPDPPGSLAGWSSDGRS